MKTKFYFALTAMAFSLLALFGAIHWAYHTEEIRNSFWLYYTPIPFLILVAVSAFKMRKFI